MDAAEVESPQDQDHQECEQYGRPSFPYAVHRGSVAEAPKPVGGPSDSVQVGAVMLCCF